MSINCQIDKQNVAYSHNRLLLANKKESSTDTWCNVNEPLKHYAEGKPVTKDHMLEDSTHMKCPE